MHHLRARDQRQENGCAFRSVIWAGHGGIERAVTDGDNLLSSNARGRRAEQRQASLKQLSL